MTNPAEQLLAASKRMISTENDTLSIPLGEVREVTVIYVDGRTTTFTVLPDEA